MTENTRSTDQISTSLSIETLQEIIRNCQRNEQCLHELKRHTRHERKKAQQLLRETYQQTSILPNNESKPKLLPAVEFFISFDNNSTTKNHALHYLQYIQDKSIQSDNSHRVRFKLPENNFQSTTKDDELSRQCEDFLSRLQTHRKQATTFENYDAQLITLQKALELLRPQFISHSRQRVEHINHLREERERHPDSVINHDIQSTRLPFSYQDMKQAAKKKYEQLPEVTDRLQQGLRNEIRRRNYLRAKIFRIRLRQHVLLHGRTNIDRSLTMIDI